MNPVSRNDLKAIFKKVKKLHIPDDLEEVEFESLFYYSWMDESSQSLFMVADYKGKLAGLKLSFIKSGSGPLKLGFCEFCHKGRKHSEVLFVAGETRKRPKKVNYRSRGTWICADFSQCNRDLKNPTRVEEFFFRLIDDI